jgi:hypothetical protein
MNDRTYHRTLIWAALAIVAVGTSCRQQAEVAGPPAATARPAEPGPEESFALTVETFRRGIEDIEIGFVVHEASGHSRMTGKNEVRHELIHPKKQGDPYRGVITVESQSSYSIKRTIDSDGSDAEDQPNKSSDGLAQPQEGSGAEVFDPALVAAPNGEQQAQRPTAGDSDNSNVTVARRPDHQERKYELVYENGRWVLTTKLDTKTEKSIQYAFDRALGTQT